MNRLTAISHFKVGDKVFGLPSGANRRNSEPVAFEVWKVGRKYVELKRLSGGYARFVDDYLPETGVTKEAIRSKVGSPDSFEFFATMEGLAKRVKQKESVSKANRCLRSLIYRSMTPELAEDLLEVMEKHGVKADD